MSSSAGCADFAARSRSAMSGFAMTHLTVQRDHAADPFDAFTKPTTNRSMKYFCGDD